LTTKRPKRIKTLVGAASFVHVPGDVSPDFAAKRAAELARIAEAHRITGLFTADLLQVDPAGLSRTTGLQDPLITLAGLAQVTSKIGLIATVSTTYLHPYNLARQIGTLDHASGGRAAWNAVTSSVGEENFGGSDIPTPEERYERGAEFIEVVNALFDANEKGVVRRSRDGAVLVDHERFHRIDYRGKHFQVAGPLNVPPPPQGRPVQFQAGQSRNGVALGARLAEVVYTSQPTLSDAIVFATDIRSQAKAFGRVSGLPFIQNALHAVIGESEADVARRVREKHEKIDYVRGRLQLADMLGGDLDLSDLPLDKPLPESLFLA
jgi:FMN-dependent oxidoreductase (nitrilotriacetate monooxygenase family)